MPSFYESCLYMFVNVAPRDSPHPFVTFVPENREKQLKGVFRTLKNIYDGGFFLQK